MKEIKFIDLFAGIGGFRLGLERANKENTQVRETSVAINTRPRRNIPNTDGLLGTSKLTPWNTPTFNCIWSCDIDKYCEQVYKKNFGEGFDCHDITTYDVSRIPDHELLCAGFPCQAFSIAGKRRGFEDARGTLFFEICRVLRAKGTPYILLENVKGLLSHDDGATFLAILRHLDELGYDCQWEVLNSKNFGVPQNRERVFIIGHLREQPRPKIFPLGEGDIQDDERRIMREQFDVSGKGYGSQQDRVYDPVGLMACLPNANPNNKLNIFLPQPAQALQTDGFLRQGIRWGTDNPQSTRNIRRLTPIECERLQGFPDGWTDGMTDTQRYKMMGNAVTVNVVEAIGKRILNSVTNDLRM